MRLNEKANFETLRLSSLVKYVNNSVTTEWSKGYLNFFWDENDNIWILELLQSGQPRITLRLQKNNITSTPSSVATLHQAGFLYISCRYNGSTVFAKPHSDKDYEELVEAFYLVKDIQDGKYEKFRDCVGPKAWSKPKAGNSYNRFESKYLRNGGNHRNGDKPHYNRYSPGSYRANGDDSKRQKLDSSSCYPTTKSPTSNGGQFELRSPPPSKDFFPYKPLANSPNNKKNLVNGDHAAAKKENQDAHSAQRIPGFPNIGNTCYMNSVLQSLYNIHILTRELAVVESRLMSQIASSSLIRNFLSVLRGRNSGKVDKSLLESFKQALYAVEPSFIGDFQHDAHEFLSILLDKLKEEYSAAIPKSEPNLISKVFEFQLVNTLVCNRCQKQTPKEETFLMLSVEIPKPGNKFGLQDAIDQSLMPEKMEYKCESCSDGFANCVKTFASLPRVLVLHLKRYHYSSENQSVKVSTPVATPTYVTLNPHITHNTRLPADFPPGKSTPLTDKASDQSEEVLAKINGLKGGREDMAHRKEEENKENLLPPPGHLLALPCPPEQELSEDTQVQMAMTQSIQDAEELELKQALDESLTSSCSNGGGGAEPERQVLVRSLEEEQRIRDNLDSGYLPHSYRLVGVVSHSGKNSYNGHYVADVFHSGQWWHCNDEGVSLRSDLPPSSVGYLFFYVANDYLPH